MKEKGVVFHRYTGALNALAFPTSLIRLMDSHDASMIR